METSSARPSVRQRRQVSFSEENLNEVRQESRKWKEERERGEGRVGWRTAFLALAIARYFSAKSNVISDCDEVFNYWEPLHYLLYKSGFQTWEYSSEFALRSYVYLLFHALFVGPASWWYGTGPGKVQVFYLLRLVLGLLSAGTEATLVAAASWHHGKRLGVYTMMLLCFTSGCFMASTSFLPSTFAMYTMTLASASVLAGKYCTAVAVAAFGVIIGWPFSVLAAVPYVLYALAYGGFKRVVLAGMGASLTYLVPSVLADYYFYGRWTSSVWNLVAYNVFGGGDSTLYGVEGSLFYLRNGFNNFNVALLFAFLFPFLVLSVTKTRHQQLLLAVSPLYLWFGFMSLQPHKEERFLYPIYPLICLAAAAFIEAIPDMIPGWFHLSDARRFWVGIAKMSRPLFISVVLVLSYSRTTSILLGYSAPMQVYRSLPLSGGSLQSATGNDNVSYVCVGAEWYRYPSSFFLPSPSYEVVWLDDGFRGLLPLPFKNKMGGTASAPLYFNNQNQASPEQFLKDDERCSFLVELSLERPGVVYRGSDKTKWQTLSSQRYLDKESSPMLHRAFFIPWLWEEKNKFASYRLLERRQVLSN